MQSITFDISQSQRPIDMLLAEAQSAGIVARLTTSGHLEMTLPTMNDIPHWANKLPIVASRLVRHVIDGSMEDDFNDKV